jgi:hypothetical protein
VQQQVISSRIGLLAEAQYCGWSKSPQKQCGLQFVFTTGEFLDTRNQHYIKEGHEDVL